MPALRDVAIGKLAREKERARGRAACLRRTAFAASLTCNLPSNQSSSNRAYLVSVTASNLVDLLLESCLQCKRVQRIRRTHDVIEMP